MTNFTLAIQFVTTKSIGLEIAPNTLPPDSRACFEVGRDASGKYVTKVTRESKGLTPREISDVLAKAITFIEAVAPDKYVPYMSSNSDGDGMEIYIGIFDSESN